MRKLFSILILLLCVSAQAQVNFQNAQVNNAVVGADTSGGGVTWTLIAHVGQNGSTGDTTTAPTNTATANLGIVLITYASGSTPTLSDSLANTWAGGQVGSFSSGRTAIYYCTNLTAGAAHTVTSGLVGACNVEFLAFKKTGGVPAFHSVSTGTHNPDWIANTVTPGSITPATGFSLFVNVANFNIGNGAGHAVDSGFTMIDSPRDNSSGSAPAKQDTAYKIKSSDSSAENPGWTDSAHVDSDIWVIQQDFQ